MAHRFERGKVRASTPRLKDVPRPKKSEPNPLEGRKPDGKFDSGNRLSEGQGFKALVRRSLGDPEDPAVADLTKTTRALYLHTLKSLPSDGPGVRPLVAAQARHMVLATYYSNAAVKAGLETKQGLVMAEASRSHDVTAQRLSVTAYDRAVREAANKPRKARAWESGGTGGVTPDYLKRVGLQLVESPGEEKKAEAEDAGDVRDATGS